MFHYKQQYTIIYVLRTNLCSKRRYRKTSGENDTRRSAFEIQTNSLKYFFSRKVTRTIFITSPKATAKKQYISKNRPCHPYSTPRKHWLTLKASTSSFKCFHIDHKQNSLCKPRAVRLIFYPLLRSKAEPLSKWKIWHTNQVSLLSISLWQLSWTKRDCFDLSFLLWWKQCMLAEASHFQFLSWD